MKNLNNNYFYEDEQFNFFIKKIKTQNKKIKPQKYYENNLTNKNLLNTNDGLLLAAISAWDLKGVLFALKNGANPNSKITKTPFLHLACAQNSPPLVKLLIDYGANIYQLNEDDENCAHVAAKTSRASVLRVLKAINYDFEKTDYLGRTPLNIAAAYGNLAALTFFIDSKANIEHSDNLGNTPFLNACSTAQGDVIAKLITQKCNYLAINNSGLNGVDLIERLGVLKTRDSTKFFGNIYLEITNTKLNKEKRFAL